MKKNILNDWDLNKKEFNDWINIWEKMQVDTNKDDNLANVDFFGQYGDTDYSSPPDPADYNYWYDYYNQNLNVDNKEEEEEPFDKINGYEDSSNNKIIHEQKQNKPKRKKKKRNKKTKDELPKKADLEMSFSNNTKDNEDKDDSVTKKNKKSVNRLLHSPNPIYHYSIGKDQEPKVTKNWTGGKKLEQIAELRLKLEKLENELIKKINDNTSKKAINSLNKKIKNLCNKIDDLLDSLSGTWADEEN